jgi:hypothetical protein
VLNFLVGALPTAPLFAWVGLRLWRRVQSPGFTPAGDLTLFSTTEVLALTGLVLVAQVVVVPLQHTYATAFYGEASEVDPGDADDDPTTDAGATAGRTTAGVETEPGTDAGERAASGTVDDAGGDDSRWAPDSDDGPAGGR